MQRFLTIAFYNCENLFDPFEDPNTLDREYTPTGYKKWTLERYENKINKLAKAISKIGEEETGNLPTLVGLSEVENASVLKDLIHTPYLKEGNYGYIHFDSYDERGIDVALLYRKDLFEVLHASPIHPPMLDNGSGRDRTRDVLYVKGKLWEETMHFFVLHLPSQREEQFNAIKRDAITTKLRDRIDDLYIEEENPAIMVMGDFNDSPDSKTLKRNLSTQKGTWFHYKTNLYNPMELFGMQKKFTNLHGKTKLLFDQLLFSRRFLSPEEKPHLFKADVFNPHFLQDWDRKRKGNPFRTYAGRKYLGGYSDHFPIYAILKF